MATYSQENMAQGCSLKGRHVDAARTKGIVSILLESAVYFEMKLEERRYLINYLLKTYSRC